MSRRTKFIITALFLVLLAIPGGYIALTWSPANPLTFRVVPLPESLIQFDDNVTQVYVRVENTSAATIYVESAMLHWSPEPVWGIDSVGSINPEYQTTRKRLEYQTTRGTLGFRDYLEIPPHSSINVVALVANKQVNDANAGRLQVTPAFKSSTKHRITELCVWLYNHLPGKLSPQVPLPKLDTAEATLGGMTD